MQVETIRRLLTSPLGTLDLAASLIIAFCVGTLFMAIAINFAEANHSPTKRERRSLVETGTMTLFFVVYYAAARMHIGELPAPMLSIRIPLAVISLAIIILGTVVNIRGRMALGNRWANQIKIYEDHALITKGPYMYVRHPLYASLIWMFLAGSALYWNWFLLVLTIAIFIPFMTWRAKQEEELLEKSFPDYNTYRRKTGMFFPRLLRYRV